MRRVDIVIISNNMLGLALASGLHGSGFLVVLLHKNESLKSSVKNTQQNSNISIINYASKKLFNYLNIWSEIVVDCTSFYQKMEIWDKDGFGHIILDSTNTNLKHLGYIIENTVIYNALWQQVQKFNDIMLISDQFAKKVMWTEKAVFVTLHNDDILAARLVVGADGMDSWLRSKADIPCISWDCHYHALVAKIRTAESHNTIAKQIFHDNSILSFLPLDDLHLGFIVWLLITDKAQQMSELTSDTLNQMLYVALDGQLGLCNIENIQCLFPLTASYAQQFTNHRLALVGDAACTIHSLFGQEINLGFMDIALLIGELKRLHYENKDIGQQSYLKKYDCSRRYSAIKMLIGMKSLIELFAESNLFKKILRNFSLKLVNIIPGVKLKLLRQVVGFNDLPKWLR